MDRTQFKQRIVGAVVLVALGVIFIPMILDQEIDDSPISGTNIPIKPEKLQELSEQKPPAIPDGPIVDRNKPRLVDEHTPPVEQTDSVSPDTKQTAKPAKVEPATTKPTESKTTSVTDKPGSVTRAWVVQVASFSERNKALKLRDRLRKANYKAFVESLSTSKGTRYRVRVGPVVQRKKADSLKIRIAKEFKIKDALVMSHP